MGGLISQRQEKWFGYKQYMKEEGQSALPKKV